MQHHIHLLGTLRLNKQRNIYRHDESYEWLAIQNYLFVFKSELNGLFSMYAGTKNMSTHARTNYKRVRHSIYIVTLSISYLAWYWYSNKSSPCVRWGYNSYNSMNFVLRSSVDDSGPNKIIMYQNMNESCKGTYISSTSSSRWFQSKRLQLVDALSNTTIQEYDTHHAFHQYRQHQSSNWLRTLMISIMVRLACLSSSLVEL